MKKALSIILTFVILACLIIPGFANDKAGFGAYKHVFIIGIDGAGRFIKDVDTPNFDRIFKDGAVKYDARAETVTNSSPNWGAILTGASYFVTGLSNDITGEKERTSETKYPTVFTYARKAFPKAELASFVNWNNINFGIIENDIEVNKVNVKDDEKLTDAICEYFAAGNAPALFYVQLDSVDHVGHDLGSKSKEYFEQIKIVDGYLGRIYDSIAESGLLDDSLFIVAADHGHTSIGGHGGITMRESQVTVAMVGKTVVKGGQMDKDTRNRDIASVALYALGIDRPDNMTSRIPANLFDGVDGETRSTTKDLTDTVLGSLAWIITLFTSLFE